jgi:alanyl-tRNA synthetase
MQFDRNAEGHLSPLPKPSIDTGMGLERITAVLQGKHDNYDIDLMRALIEASAEASHTTPDGPHAVSHRVIADHLRASSFLIADGALPANEGRGYVLRRIMRRAMRHAHILGAREPLMWKLVPALVREMGDAYAELGRAQNLIAETLKLEETRFKQTLERGLKILEDETSRLGQGKALPGDVAFKLYDTFGFPLDLTQDILRGQGRSVEIDGFNTAMEKQREAARAAWAGSGEAADETVWFDLRQKLGPTEFLGYDADTAEGKVVALLVAGKPVDKVEQGQDVSILVNQSPFYAESGGQMGDSGIFFTPHGAEIAISDTVKKLGDLHVHVGKVQRGSLAVGDVVEMRIDTQRRDALRANHSATHLLHEALRRQLGTHISQKGSLVAPERLRFDISHNKALSPEELRKVEEEVNAKVRHNSEVLTRLMNQKEAVEAGAMALFGEKYGDEVRVLSMGDDETGKYSVELCGGTHVRRTGDIGLFKIVGEGAVAAGVRRIEAVTGAAADEYVRQRDQALQGIASLLKARPEEAAERVAALLEDRKRLERELNEARKALAMSGGMSGAARADGAGEVKNVAGISFIGRTLDGVPAKDLKGMADEFKKQVGSGLVALVGVHEGKASSLVAVTDDLTDRMNAVDYVRAGVEALGGKGGGGRADMAQGGGPDVANAARALAAIEAAVAAKGAA